MKLIDLSHTLSADTPLYPGDSPTALSLYRRLETDDYNAFLLQTGLHTGTHIDMPMHLLADQRTAAAFSAECFAGHGVLLDVRGEERICMKDEYQKKVSPGDIVLLYTGMDTRYMEQEVYFHAYPSVEEEFSSFLCSRGIKMLGMDMPSPDYSPFPVHRALLSRDIFLLEDLTNLQSLMGIENFEVLALPLKIEAEASFVRAVARVY